MGIWSTRRLHVIDSHTGGEPTRVVISGWPGLPNTSMQDRLEHLRRDHDDFRSAVVNEPRGSDAMVGAVLCDPIDPACVAGVIYFNNVGYLGMCVHGTIGLIATLAHLGRIRPGDHKIETPVGIVSTTLHETGEVTVANVPSYRYKKDVEVEVEAFGRLHGDIAWGGNWFFLVNDHHQAIDPANIPRLTDFTWRIRQGLERAGIAGETDKRDGLIDHIELFAPSTNGRADSKNFVLCPGKAYDRSPCGTGTSAKLACLYADGKLKPGDVWRQEGIIGSIFEGSVKVVGDVIHPFVKGSAFVNGEATLILEESDPYCMGIRL
jgi:4-hydroxyproline epimerase